MVTTPTTTSDTPSGCQSCKARHDGLCAASRDDARPVIAGYKSGDLRLAAGQDLFRPGEPHDAIYNLVDGWVYLYSLLEDGRQQILHFGLPGAVLGFSPSPGASATYGVRALTEATVCVIPRENFRRLSEAHPDMGLRLAWLFSRDRALFFGHIASVGRHNARERVAHLLVELFFRARAQSADGDEDVLLPLSQSHIGDATGLTGVHVNRVLNELRRQGIVELRYRRVVILDPERLVRIAGMDPNLLLPWTQPRLRPGEHDDGLQQARRAA